MDDIDSALADFPKFSKNEDIERKIPVPDLSFLKEEKKELQKKGEEGALRKHEKAYDAFCRWVALPQDEREPKTETAFEKRWKLPKSHTVAFRQRSDYRNRRLMYFWEWMMDKLPDVFKAVYRRALHKSSADARIFAELITKHLDVQRPPSQMTQIIIQGVSQEKINNLFVPEGYEKIEDVIPQKEDG